MKKDFIAQVIRIMGYVLIGISVMVFLLAGLLTKEYGMFAGLIFGTPFLVTAIFILGFSRIIELLHSIDENQKKMLLKDTPHRYQE